ncbi:MAG: FAD-binding protein [Deltaproteobacteria bacterium]|nr:FAD-binding protein [Deltaproteobacteria bacterium]
MEEKTVKELKKIVGADGVLSTPEDLAVYGYDGTFEDSRPEIVVLPETTEEVSEILKLASRERIPVVTRGMGSGMTGASVPYGGGIVLTMTKMNKIIELDEENGTVMVESGIITAELQAEVEKKGLYYPPDPSSNRHSTIGGNIACNAGGPRCLKYGVTGDYVLALTVVLSDGRILKTGGRTIKDVVGYDLKSLFTGSEGTLGVITEARLKLIAKPSVIRTVRAEFPSLADASRTVNAILTAGIVPVTLEIMDDTTIACIEEAMHLGLPLDVEAILIIEADGSDEESVAREIERIEVICRKNGARGVKAAKDEKERNDLWNARRPVGAALARKSPNKLGEDIAVPRSAVPEAVRRLKDISARYGLPIAIFGHAGDGNLHPNVLFDLKNPEERETMEKMIAEIFETALALGGTLSGEHGVGKLKLPFMERAVDAVSLDVQKQIRHVFDPLRIMNPGKALPE